MVALRLVLVTLSVLTVMAVAGPLEAPFQCIKDSYTCVHQSECCGGCCVESVCVQYADSCVKEVNPCATHACAQGKKCYMSPVQCIQAPCPSIPACKSDDRDYDE